MHEKKINGENKDLVSSNNLIDSRACYIPEKKVSNYRKDYVVHLVSLIFVLNWQILF